MVTWGRKKGGNSKYVTFKGKAVYVKPFVPDEYNGVETWKAGLTVTKESFAEMKEQGVQLHKKLAEDVPGIDENTPFVTFKRQTEKQFRDNLVHFCPPVIYDKDGNPLVYYVDDDDNIIRQFNDGEVQPERRGELFAIGNGSEIEVTVCIYPAGSFGFGTRLESIKVLDLIEYSSEDDTQYSAYSKDSKDFKDKEEEGEAGLDDEIPFEEEAEKAKKVEKTEKKSVSSSGKVNKTVGW